MITNKRIFVFEGPIAFHGMQASVAGQSTRCGLEPRQVRVLDGDSFIDGSLQLVDNVRRWTLLESHSARLTIAASLINLGPLFGWHFKFAYSVITLEMLHIIALANLCLPLCI